MLGSPVANLALRFIRPKEEEKEENPGSGMIKNKPGTRNERIDSEKVAEEAIAKARNTLELRKYLDESKSDWDRIRELQNSVDQQTAEWDNKNKK